MAINGTPNNTGDDEDVCLHSKREEWVLIVLPVYILLISVLGIVFNLFVLMIIWLHKKTCTVAEIYLSNLAAADLVLSTALPFWAVNAANDYNWLFSTSLCRLVSQSIIMNALCSVYFLVLVSIDRYVALVHPLSTTRMRRPKYAKVACLLVWAFGLLLSVPMLIYRENKYYPDHNVTRCYLKYPNDTVYVLCEGMQIIFIFIIPIPIICFCTVKIIQVLKKRLNSQKKEQKATSLVLAVLLAFVICWVPFHCVKVLEILHKAKVLTGCSLRNVIDTCKQVVIYIAFFNSALNPVLYVIVGKNFRTKVNEVCKRSVNMKHSSMTSIRSYIARSVK